MNKLFLSKKILFLGFLSLVSISAVRAEQKEIEAVVEQEVVLKDVVAQEEAVIKSHGCEEFTLESANFLNRGSIPDRNAYYHCNMSPALNWKNAPGCTETFAIIMEDLNTPVGEWSHWVIYNIPACFDSLHEDICHEVYLPHHIRQGINDFGEIGYGGPAPECGTHTYLITIYALETCLEFDCETLPTKQTMMYAMKDSIISQATLIGTYEDEC